MENYLLLHPLPIMMIVGIDWIMKFLKDCNKEYSIISIGRKPRYVGISIGMELRNLSITLR